MDSFNLNSYLFEWCEWNDSNGGNRYGGALYVISTNANLSITSCSFHNCSCTGGCEGGALYCGNLQKLDIAKSNFTNCSAAHGGAVHIRYMQSNSVWSFSENKVETCQITDWCGTGWYFRINNMTTTCQFLFTKCKCIANTGGDASGSLAFHWPPNNKPNKFLITECQFINNKLTSSSTYGGAGIYFDGTYSWMNGIKFIAFCFFDGNSATNGRGNDVFFNGSITQSPFQQCGSTTPTKRVWNAGTADNAMYNSWLPIIDQNKIVANSGSDVDSCGKTQQSSCATVEYALGCIAPFGDASLSLLFSTFTPTQTLTFRAPNTKITGNGTDATTIASSGIPQPPNSHSHSSQSTSSFSSFSSFSSASSSPDPSVSPALFQQTQGSLTVSSLAIAHNSTNPITPILFHLSYNSPSLNLNTTTITGTTSSSSSITTPLFFLTAGSLTLNHTAITSLALNSQSIFHLTSLTAPLALNFSNITDITSTATPTSCVLSSTTSRTLSLSLANCTITNIYSEQLSQQTATNGGCISFASSASANSFSVSDTSFTYCRVSEDVNNGGKGGGIFLDCSLNEGGFMLSSISFSGCRATVGKNMFVKSGNLVNTVKTERFAFDCSDYEEDGNAFVGEDGIYGEMDLRVFLVYLKWVEVSVSKDGHDTLGCGSETFPCQSMKSGIDHVDRSEAVGERKVNVKDEGTIEDIYSFTDALVIDGCVNEGDVIKHRPVHFEVTINGDSAISVISSTDSLSLLSLELQIPSQFVPSMNSLISSSGVSQLKDCSFEIQSSTTVQYSLITMTTGSCTLTGCSLADCSFSNSPFVMASSVLLENSNFSNIKNTGRGEEGGVAKVTLQENEELVIKSTNASSCSLSSENGKGGFLYLDCQNCLNKKPFVFDVGITFENNEAAIGKNVFISASDLNKTVTNESFNFNYLSMINDENLFVGTDNYHQENDLFMFLVPYSSTEMFISSNGFDVARCGSEEEPCFTMWKGIENIEKEIGKKTIQIAGSTIIRDSFNMSNYHIKKDSKMGEENVKATLNFEKSIGSQLEYFMENDDHLELTNIQLKLSSGFDNSAKTIISNKNGELVISECSFHSEARVSNGFDCVFVDAIGGSVEVNDLSMESCDVGSSIFVIHDAGVSCHFLNIRVKYLNESGGCILSIKKSESGLKINEVGEEMSLNIDNSSFSGVKRSDNGSSILESASENKICLVVNESNITEDKAEESEKGGGIFFTLGASGSMKVIDSTISHCSCNNSTGRGGGVYLATKERGFLDFAFMGMKFSANTAKVGNDIFVECFNITSQINERQFQFDLREGHYIRDNAIYGRDECDYLNDTDLIGFVTIHQSDTIIVSSVNGMNDRQCGTNTFPCDSIDYGLMHLTSDFMSQMIVIEMSAIDGEINLEEMSLSSKSREMCDVEVKTGIERTREALMTTSGTVSLLRLNFVFDSNFISSHESLISPDGGILEIMNCSFSSKPSNEEGNSAFASIQFHIIKMEKGELQLDGCTISDLILQEPALYLSSSLPSVIYLFEIFNSTIKTSLININECGQLTIKDFNTENITVEGNEESLISCSSMKKTMQLANCTISGVNSQATKGKLMKLEDCLDVKMDSCVFDGSAKERNEQTFNEEEQVCKWDGSLVDVVKSSVMMKDTAIWNSPDGGITMSEGNVNIEMGLFENNNPSIEGYPSLRRNIICSDSGTLNVMSLKGGDGVFPNSSLWMLKEGCSFEGIVSERDSSFFIPVLESVEAKEETDRMKLIFKGMLLVPCNLSFSVVKRKGEEKEIEKHDFDSNGFLSEREVEGSVGKDLISSCGDEIEVSVHILFGNADSPSSTHLFILKNASKAKVDGDEKLVEGGNEGKSNWLLIVIIMAVILVIVLIVSVVLAVRWRKVKNEAEDLRDIVNDTVKKDPKAFEMVTMEMSPEEQWRRAEKEAEKKNEERIKKRVYEKSLGHSESSEHLLSESGSTEYILGRDSDKIPEWMLEKVEEEEETRKRSPSPSISSTSTTSTTDSDSTFVRGEDLCPTTSSMSNLVDAMACSSPHEKLIVDLRDSLFMLLHGRNKTKEMAIGTLQEREVTAAQILFWVANGALHSFDEMENPLQSLANLSPHIALFSEHMVICIVMHSDLLLDDSDSSSISSSTVVTSASDDDDSLPSSAFEDEDSFKKECLRWKAPELLMNMNMEATKSSVAFSIGMMLWECLTLQIPFGEYPAEVAGQKIANEERPDQREIEESVMKNLVNSCLSGEASKRPALNELKKELVGLFPAGTFIVTMTDAILVEESREEHDEDNKYKEGAKEEKMEANKMKDKFDEK